MSILEEIVARKQAEIHAINADGGEARLRRAAFALAAEAPPRGGRIGFAESLRRPGLRIAAEVKRASPSKGVIAPDLDPAALAREYARRGAAAVSVLTEPFYFKGSPADFAAVRAAVPALPLLRKDFITDAAQIYESRVMGADAVLLIARILDDAHLADFQVLARELGMDALVEIHSEAEAGRAAAAGASLVGVNNRDLATFAVDASRAARVARLLPPGVLTLALSGVQSAADVAEMARGGMRAFLIGEALAKTPALLSEINAGGARVFPAPLAQRIKVCGITRQEDASLCAELGFGAAGFVFFKGSPRFITPEAAGALQTGGAARVGVFTGAGADEIRAAASAARLDAVQLHPARSEDSDGALSSSAAGGLLECGLRVIKVFRTPAAARGAVKTLPRGVAPLLECSGGALPGGNGAAWDWRAAAEFSSGAAPESAQIPPCGFLSMLDGGALGIAGGLSPESAARAAVESGAAWLDISSGVESSPGMKDHGRLRALADA